MKNNRKKCSSKKHLEIDANKYCKECKIYLCNKCQNHHSEFNDHQLYDLDKDDINDLFTDICQIQNHQIKYQFFCKTHNQLCCGLCISKIKNELYGQHTDCNVCLIKDIKDEKKNKLKDNIKLLEELSNTLEDSINKLKILYEKVNENKEELKKKFKKYLLK